MMTPKSSAPEIRPEDGRGAVMAAHLEGKLPESMDARGMTPEAFVRRSMRAAGWPEPLRWDEFVAAER